MLFGNGLVRSLGLFVRAEVDVDCLGMGVGTVDGIAEVHEEGRAPPSQAGLDVGVREVCSVEEVGGCDSDGVGRPELEAWIIFIDIEDEQGGVPEMGTYGGWMSIAGNGPMDCGVVPESTSGWELRERAGRAMLSFVIDCRVYLAGSV